MQNDDQNRSGLGLLRYIWTEWVSTFVVLVLLLLTLVIGTGEMIHGQLLRMGERIYGDPASGMQYSFLRAEPTAPKCERNVDIDATVQKQLKIDAADEYADFFGVRSEADVRAAVVQAQQVCEESYVFYDKAIDHIEANPSIRAYRNFETSFFGLFKFGTENRALLLVIMVVFAAISATLKTHHIGLRSPATRIDFRLYSIAMLVANAFLAFSSYSQYQSMINSGVPLGEMKYIYWLWMILFSTLTLISLFQVIKLPKPTKEGGSIGMAFLSIPLYAYMAITTGVNFTFFMDYPMGQGIYLGQLVEFSSIFLNLALFIWAGMLLKQTRVVDLFLNILRPWNLAPETLTWLILLAAALPTAYTGASGIFVIAAGAIIYKEVWNAGGRRQFALAATAMSGSLGVVLRPCLLIVVVASLNKEVTTDLLYHYGIYVFLLSSTLFLVISLFIADNKFRIASPSVAAPQSGRAFLAVIPYIVIFVLTWMFYKFALSTDLNEFTAPVMMPVILLMVVLFDKLRHEPAPLPPVGHWDATLNTQANAEPVPAVERAESPLRQLGFWKSIHISTSETVGHIGALIILMALSVSVGGLLERMEIMEAFPTDISSTILVITMIVGLMIFVGMIMDPFGAVILISATVAPVAYQYGIDPVHFWMITLIGFELGYVTPPVALNHLLARQSIGDAEVAEADAEVRHLSFYYRYERWILPVIVLLPAMLIIAYVPYIFKLFGWYS
ncbi:TRAP transporter large permease subunit [Acinetobacter wanghuae]|uniref:TRAP transporter large permease subunit n=1 Tax=Acinetobacter wanghuae TaxID=2662362 RepID=A0A5Q0P413_9GAMM|nr:TRAP transporter large permease subunit [Acinetobacter wanghuae]MQW92482.1 TRAP transporter large permease subunit [Acinetobacter wanghuae]QGA11885.1 TRAP transporter large permease subunit [Acinetobacter wanghuae]